MAGPSAAYLTGFLNAFDAPSKQPAPVTVNVGAPPSGYLPQVVSRADVAPDISTGAPLPRMPGAGLLAGLQAPPPPPPAISGIAPNATRGGVDLQAQTFGGPPPTGEIPALTGVTGVVQPAGGTFNPNAPITPVNAPPTPPPRQAGPPAGPNGPPAPPPQVASPQQAASPQGDAPLLPRPIMTPGIAAHERPLVGKSVLAARGTNIAERTDLAGDTLAVTQEAELRAAMAARQQADEQAAYRAELARRQAQNDAEAKAKTDDYLATVANVAAMGQLDPDRFWASKSTPNKILTIAGVFLGAIGAAGSGKENDALKVIEKQTEADLAAQRFSYQSGLDALKGITTGYGMLMDRYGNQQAADHGIRAAQLDRVAAILREQQAMAGSAEAKAAFNVTLGQISDLKRHNTETGTGFVQAQGGGVRYQIPGQPGTYSEKDAQRYTEAHGIDFQEKAGLEISKVLIDHGGKDAKDQRALFVPTDDSGGGYSARSETEANNHRKQVAATQRILDTTARMRALNPGAFDKAASGPYFALTETGRRVRSVSEDLLGALKEANELGALDKGVERVIGEMQGDPLSFLGNKGNLDEIERSARNKRAQLQQSATGARPPVATPSFQGDK